MNEKTLLSPAELAAAKKRRLEAMHLQAIEGDPLTSDQIAVFEMFEREAWSHERRRAYLHELLHSKKTDGTE